MITINKLHKKFNNKRVLNGVSLSIPKGEFFVLIGQSGCGKSVLLKHCLGLLSPDMGHVSVNGVNLNEASRQEVKTVRLMMGMLFQHSSLFDSLNVSENIGFALREHRMMNKKQIAVRVEECLEMVGLAGLEEAMPHELSGGMRKRVAMARAVACNPQVIFYDEPTTGLDPVIADQINDLMIKLHKNLQMTAIAVTHDMHSAYKIANRIAFMKNGVVDWQGKPNDLKKTTNSDVRAFVDKGIQI